MSMKLIASLLVALFCASCQISARDPPTELEIEVTLKVECSEEEKTINGDNLSMHYTGTFLSDGSKFDSSRDRNRPLDFALGTGRVIAGWDQGLLGMCKGEKRILTIPYALAYGEKGRPPKIPAKSDLVFDVELVDYQRKAKSEL